MTALHRQEGWPRQLADALTRHLVESRDRGTLILLLLALAVDYGERTLIGALGPTLENVFHFGNTTLGLLAAVSTLISGLATLPLGWLTDRTKRVRLLAISLIIWAAAVGMVGASVVVAMLFGARLLLGAVGAVTGPAVPSLIGDLVPADQRGRAMGLVESGQLVGTGFAFIIAALLGTLLSFRACFWLMAGLGVVVAIAFLRATEPRRTRAAGPSGGEEAQGTVVQKLVREQDIEPDEGAIAREDPGEMSLWQAARYVFNVPTNIIVMISRTTGDYFLAAISTFGVVFATQQYGLGQGTADLVVLVLGIGAILGFILVARLGDALLDRGHIQSRLWLGALGYLLAPFPLYFGMRTHSLALALPLFTVGAFFVAGSGPTLDAVRVDVVIPRLRGRAEAVRQVARSVGEAAAPIIFGIISGLIAGGHARGLQIAFETTLPVLMLSGLVLLFALRFYGRDVAAALASSKRLADDQAREESASSY